MVAASPCRPFGELAPGAPGGAPGVGCARRAPVAHPWCRAIYQLRHRRHGGRRHRCSVHGAGSRRHPSSWPRWSSPRCAPASGGAFSPRRFCTGISGTSSATWCPGCARNTSRGVRQTRARAAGVSRRRHRGQPCQHTAVGGFQRGCICRRTRSPGVSADGWRRRDGLARLDAEGPAPIDGDDSGDRARGLLLHRQRWPCRWCPRGCLRRCAQCPREPDRWRVAAPSRRRRFRRVRRSAGRGSLHDLDACCTRGDRGPRAVSGIARARASGMVSPGRDCARHRALALFALLGPLHRPAPDLSRQLSPRRARPGVHALPGPSRIGLEAYCGSRLGARRRVHRVAVVADRRLRTVRLPGRGSSASRRRARRNDDSARARSHATVRRLDPASHGDWLHRLRVGRAVLRPSRARAHRPPRLRARPSRGHALHDARRDLRRSPRRRLDVHHPLHDLWCRARAIRGRPFLHRLVDSRDGPLPLGCGPRADRDRRRVPARHGVGERCGHDRDVGVGRVAAAARRGLSRRRSPARSSPRPASARSSRRQPLARRPS